MRKCLLLSLLLAFSIVALADTSGPNDAGTSTSDASEGTTAWTSLENISANDDQFVQCSMSAGGNSQYLKISNFSFAIPAGSTIEGIQFTARSKADVGGEVTNLRVRIIKADGSIGTSSSKDTSTTPQWQGVEVADPVGSSSDLWGETWTSSDINDADFGIALRVSSGPNARTANIDQVICTITYTLPLMPRRTIRWDELAAEETLIYTQTRTGRVIAAAK